MPNTTGAMHPKMFFAEAALRHYIAHAPQDINITKAHVTEAVEEVKEYASVRAKIPRTGGARTGVLKFVVEKGSSIKPYQWKTWFVSNLLDHLGVSVEQDALNKSVTAAIDDLEKHLKLKRRGLRPRLIFLVEPDPMGK
ncbi:hypothetical protein HCU66_26285 [Pseudomonas frederiksbergensis]|uniref:hypothetical protein n=1 Tax=Pseudomonas frederiksbergensis TaxID=104087 RepID=UPI00197F0242|nr:hypothetical protein [Pseudomonas frederiksbergensis]MBN3865703.1 hypothetical protein [Pseudomonas frederiksbergensis]